MAVKFDSITMEIVRNALGSIADEMALVIMRTAYSAIVRDSMDYSTAVCDRHGQVVAHGLTMALHLGSFPDAMEALTTQYKDNIHEGDIFIFNDPYTAGGMHIPDVYIVKPLFVDGELEGYATTVVHQIDMGGIAPGSTAVYSQEIFQEGLRIPVVKMYERGKLNDTFARIMSINTRIPDKLEGDMNAQVAACGAAERGFKKLLTRYGSENFRAILEHLHDYAEKIARAEIADLPDGSWSFTDFLDGTGEDPEPIQLKATVTIKGSEMVVDWTGSAPQVRSAINCPSPFVKAAALLIVKCFSKRDIPNFAGYARPISQVLPKGTIVNPEEPAACAARAIIGWRAIDVLLGVFSQIVPEKACAAGEGGVTFAAISGYFEGKRFVCSECLAGSWGAMRDRDGVFGIPNAGGNSTNMPVEMVEAQFPMRVLEYGMVENSGGPGRSRGASAYIRRYETLAEETTFVMRSDRRRHLPFSVEDGMPGTPSMNIVYSKGQTQLIPVMPMEPIVLKKGDVFCHIGAGGGGFGDPLERDTKKCLEDITYECYSPQYAREVYGVVLTEDGTQVDEAATRSERERLRQECQTHQPAYLKHFLKPYGYTDFQLKDERLLFLQTEVHEPEEVIADIAM